LGRNRLTSGRCSWPRALAAGLLAVAIATTATACGDDGSSGAEENEGTYEVEVTRSEFPRKQRLGQTTQMVIGVRNSGDETVPALSVTITVAGEEGETSSLPFAVHDRQPDLAQPDRPVWVLAEDFPKLVGSTKNAGTSSTNDKSFDFGPLKAGRTVEGVWKLSAVREGSFTVRYAVDADLGGSAKAETAGGDKAGGSFEVEITAETRDLEVTDSGEVVEVGEGAGQGRQPAGKKNDDG
jgi:hypothetical protein